MYIQYTRSPEHFTLIQKRKPSLDLIESEVSMPKPETSATSPNMTDKISNQQQQKKPNKNPKTWSRQNGIKNGTILFSKIFSIILIIFVVNFASINSS